MSSPRTAMIAQHTCCQLPRRPLTNGLRLRSAFAGKLVFGQLPKQRSSKGQHIFCSSDFSSVKALLLSGLLLSSICPLFCGAMYMLESVRRQSSAIWPSYGLLTIQCEIFICKQRSECFMPDEVHMLQEKPSAQSVHRKKKVSKAKQLRARIS